MILKFLMVVALSSFEIYASIVAGYAAGLSRLEVLVATLIGGICGVFIAAFLGEKIEHFINNTIRKNKAPKPKSKFAVLIFEKYGVIGLSTIATFLLGAPIAMGVGVGFNAPLKKMIPMCIVTVIIRCFVFTFFGEAIKAWMSGL